MKDRVLNRIRESGIVAIVRGIERETIIPLVYAIKQGGIDCVEVTFNTPNAVDMIRDIRMEFNDRICVGAGTVTNRETAVEAYNAGAEFILSPNVNSEVIRYCNEKGIVAIPGAYTPTEITEADMYGADIVKVFPAGVAGPDYIKMVKGPLDNVEIMSVGGVNIENAGEFIRKGSMSIGVGGSLVDRSLIKIGKFSEITRRAGRLVDVVNGARI